MYIIGTINLQENEMLIGCKIRLLPTKEQEIFMWKSVGCARYVYNWGLETQIKNYQAGNKFIHFYDLSKLFTIFKNKEENKWLKEVGQNTLKQALKNVCEAYNLFFNKYSKFPKFKSKKKSKITFYTNYERLHQTKNGVHCEKLGEVLTAEPLPKLLNKNEHFYNTYISYDGKYWYISLNYKIKLKEYKLNNTIIGIDLGIKNLATCSSGKVYKNINKTKKVRKLDKRIKKLHHKISKKYLMNLDENNKFIKTKNIAKAEKKLKLLYRQLTNIRNTYIHRVTTDIVRTKPSKIIVEDLNITALKKNKCMRKVISEQNWYRFLKFIEYKCKLYGIEFVKADRFYPSSKLCSRCGHKKEDLKLSDRTYKCTHCGLEIDRDYNASINLANYKINS